MTRAKNSSASMLCSLGSVLSGGVVVSAFGSVENLRVVCWTPLHAGKAHGGTEHVTSDLF